MAWPKLQELARKIGLGLVAYKDLMAGAATAGDEFKNAATRLQIVLRWLSMEPKVKGNQWGQAT